MRIATLVLAAGLLILDAAPASQIRTGPFVPIGVWYGGGTVRPPMTPRNPSADREAWRTDLQAIRALGFNSVRSWVDWAGVEPQQGQYRFEALDQMLTLSKEAGLAVVLQLYAEAAPAWIGRQYPDASFVTAQGIRIGSQTTPGYCIDHPAVRDALGAFIAAVSERAARHDAFYALDLWSEPHIVNPIDLAAAAGFCYCPHTQRRFREWLQLKYGTLEALNAEWYRTFTAWDEVEAPRLGTNLTYTDLIDWKTFIAVKLREDLQFKSRASASRGARPTSSHSDMPSVTASPSSGFGIPDDWLMTTAVDYYGASIHPRPPSAAAWSSVQLALALDGIRSAGGERGWWAGGLQAGQGVAGVRVATPVTAADLRLWGWAALSRGARAISYFAWYPMSSGYESHGYGLIESDGTITDRARAAGAVAGIVSRNPALFAPLRPRPSAVAIFYNPLTHLTGGNDPEASGTAVRRSMRGFYRAMFDRNIQVDFLHPDEIVTGKASEYRAIFLGYPLMLQQPVARALGAYVRSGGTLISEARPGWSDERGRASHRVPGSGLDEVFGAREKLIRPAENAKMVEMVMERELDGPLSGLAGRTIAGTSIAEHLQISGSNVRVLARFPGDRGAPGDPAIVLSRHGSGRAILIGSYPAAAFEENPEQAQSSGDLLAALASGAGVTPDVRITGAAGAVEARYLESSAATVLIAINHAESSQKVTMAFSADTPEAIWLNLETGASVNFVAGPDGPTYTHTFQPRDVLVLMIKKDLR
jgi:beta-galactosidase